MIEDPLSRFYDEGPAPQAGIKNPKTGIRSELDTAYKKQIRDEEAKRKTEISKRIVLQLMQNEYGREWILDFLNTCNVFGNPYTTDPLRTAFNCGALFIGNAVHDSIQKYAMDEYMTMLTESRDREERWNDMAADGK